MILFRMLTALSVFVIVAGGNEAANSTLKKKHHHIHGKVEAVQEGKNGGGTITILVHQHRKKGAVGAQAAGQATERIIDITSATKIQKVFHSGKGRNKKEAATFSDLHKGQHVVVVPGSGKHHGARTVAIIARTKGKKKVQ
jgi:hypothetical protein